MGAFFICEEDIEDIAQVKEDNPILAAALEEHEKGFSPLHA